VSIDQSSWGAKLGPRIAMLVVQAVAHAHVKLHDIKHRLAMAIFHSISDMISGEVHQTLGDIFAALHDALPDDSIAKASVHFMHTQTGQLQALAGTGLQASGLLSSVATIMNNELAPAVYDVVRTNPHMLPDAGTIAQLVASQRTDAATGVDAIAANGIDNGWAEAMVSLATSFPSMTDALEMLRRGIITSDQLALWGSFNSIPEDIVGLYLQLETSPISVADAALAVLRGNLTQAQGESIAAENGFSPDSFAVLISNTGEPPGTDQLLEAYRRGIIDKATLERGILQSRYRDEWIPTIEALRYTPMSTSDAVDAVVQNNLTEAEAAVIADQNGLSPGAVDTLIATAGSPLSRTEMSDLYNRGLATKAQFTQALAESRLKDKYGDLAFALRTRIPEASELSRALLNGTIDSKDAVSKAMESGYSQDDATLLVNAGIAEKTKTYRDKVIASIEDLYLDGIISQSDALSGIQDMGYDQDEANLIVKAAAFRQDAAVTTQAVHGVRSKFLARHITSNQAVGYLNAIGLPSDQVTYLMNMWSIEQGAYTKLLTEAQIVKAVTDSLITAQDGESRLIALGYSQGDADLLLNGALWRI
jgi:hypothetical protein